MSTISSTHGYYKYNRDTIQEIQMRNIALDDATVMDLTAYRATGTRVNAVGGITAIQTTIPFENMTGNIPDKGYVVIDSEIIQYGGITWSGAGAGTMTSCKRGWSGSTAATHADHATIYSGSAFAVVGTGGIDNAVVTIPFSGLSFNDSIPEIGVIQIASEFIWYGGITYTNDAKTAGTLNYCKRGYDGSTAAVHAANVEIIFEQKMTSREKVIVVNRSSSSYSLYVGFNPTISNTGTNAIKLSYGVEYYFNIDANVRLYGILSSGGSGSVIVIDKK